MNVSVGKFFLPVGLPYLVGGFSTNYTSGGYSPFAVYQPSNSSDSVSSQFMWFIPNQLMGFIHILFQEVIPLLLLISLPTSQGLSLVNLWGLSLVNSWGLSLVNTWG
jgi:hypothetical protein